VQRSETPVPDQCFWAENRQKSRQSKKNPKNIQKKSRQIDLKRLILPLQPEIVDRDVMQIKRELEIKMVSNRRYVIRRSDSASASTTCPVCGEPMISVEQAARLTGVNQRRLFQIIETGTVHFAETEAGVAMICIASMTDKGEVQLMTPISTE